MYIRVHGVSIVRYKRNAAVNDYTHVTAVFSREPRSPPTDNTFLTSSQTISVQAGPSCSFKVQPRSPPFALPALSLSLGPPFLLPSAVPSTEGQDATVELNKELPRCKSCAREAGPVGRREQPHRGGGCAPAAVGAAVGLLERTELRPRALAARASSTDPSFPTTSAPAALKSRTTKKAALTVFLSRPPLLRMVSVRVWSAAAGGGGCGSRCLHELRQTRVVATLSLATTL